MTYVYLLFRGKGASPNPSDSVLAGVYSTYENAKAAQTRFESKLTVKDGRTTFLILQKLVDNDGWEQASFY